VSRALFELVDIIKTSWSVATLSYPTSSATSGPLNRVNSTAITAKTLNSYCDFYEATVPTRTNQPQARQLRTSAPPILVPVPVAVASRLIVTVNDRRGRRCRFRTMATHAITTLSIGTSSNMANTTCCTK